MQHVQHTHRRRGASILAAGVLLTALAIGGAQAKGAAKGGGAENVGGLGSALTCTDGGVSASAGMNRSGRTLTVSIAVGNDALGADWTLSISDNGAAAGTSNIAYAGLNWSAMQMVELTKGQHVIDVAITSTAGEVCTGSTKVKV
jgi:hypothetical protein